MRAFLVSRAAGIGALLLGCTGTIDTTPPAAGGPGSGGTKAMGAGATAGAGASSAGSTQVGTGGSVSGAGTGGSATGGSSAMPMADPEGNLPYEPPAAGPEALRARTWKLSHAEYERTVRAFLGVAPDIAELQPELDNGVFPNMSGSGFVRVPLATDYYEVAEALTSSLTASTLAALIPGGRVEAAAKSAFLSSAVEKAFRRPATAEETAAYGALFELAASEGDTALGFRAVLRALITSPYFLYRTELGEDAAAAEFTLTDYEVASLLSYSLLGEPPAADLLGAAARGELTNATTLAAHVRSLVALPQATAQLAAFSLQWLKVHHFDAEVEKDEARFPTFASIKQAMKDETVGFLGRHAGPSGTLPALLTTPLPLPQGPLGDFYLSEPSGSAGGVRTGVLALGALLSARAKPTSSSPTLRGLFVRDRFLCQQIHLPEDQPPDISETQMTAMAKTTRELYEIHASNPSCAGCHTLLDMVGFTFEDLDAAGRFRRQENAVPIDTSGELLNTDVNTVLANHTDLAEALAQSEWVRECVATQAFRFYFGVVEATRGIPPVQAGRTAIGTGSFADLVAAIMSSPTTFRRVRN